MESEFRCGNNLFVIRNNEVVEIYSYFLIYGRYKFVGIIVSIGSFLAVVGLFIIGLALICNPA